MKLFTEEQVRDEGWRARVLKEITSPENAARRAEHKRRYEVYKDKTVKWVLASLKDEGLKPETIAVMRSRASNVSVCRKVVNKLARAYGAGVTRETTGEKVQASVDDLGRLLGFDDKMRKADRYRELHKNCLVQVYIERAPDTGADELWQLKMRVLSPWQYDVIEDANDREVPRCVILSDYDEGTPSIGASEDAAGRHRGTQGARVTNGKDDVIADMDRRKGEFIWWTDAYHFTTDGDGKIIAEKSPEGGINPVKVLPFANVAEEQDGDFWAQGGDDLVDGAILVNKLLTDMFYIAYLQGFGQVVITGKGLPQNVAIGPNNALLMDYDPSKEEPKPEVTVVSANPPLDSWMQAIEQYVALLLTTNNLSPGNIAGRLDASQFPSGVAMLIEQSEATNDIEDKQRQYVAVEQRLWRLVAAWHRVLVDAKQASAPFAAIEVIPEDTDVTPRFREAKPVVSEKERLEVLQLRKDLGLNADVELLMIDNPALTEAEALEKLKKIRGDQLEGIHKEVTGQADAQPQLDAEGNPVAPPAATEGSPLPGAPAGADVQKAALNGAQVSSLLEIALAVATGDITKPTAKALLAASFPLDASLINQIIDPIVEGSKKPEPPPFAGGPKPPFGGKPKGDEEGAA